jgi:hypothetical protein
LKRRKKEKYGMHFPSRNSTFEWVSGQLSRILNFCIYIQNILGEQ